MLPAILLLLAAPANDVEEALSKLAQVYAAVESAAAEAPDPDRAIYGGAIPGAMRELDPHSAFFTKDQFDQLKEMQQSETKGFGTIVSIIPGRVIVLQVMEGGSAARAGIESGDEIVAVNGFRLAWLMPEQLMQLLSEARRREVKLEVRRQGEPRTLEYTLVPQQMQQAPVDRAFLLQPGIGYVRATNFEPDTPVKIREAIEKLGGEALHGLVLDLRGNPGGDVAAAIETAGLFLEPGQKVLTVRGRSVAGQDATTSQDAKPYHFKLAVLMNGKTASASEIVAGALQDHGRAVLAGERSYGKGLVQTVFPLSQETGMALTTAFYYTPNGRSLQRPLNEGQLGQAIQGQEDGGGLTPDVPVLPDAMDTLQRALEGSGLLTYFATDYIRKHAGIGVGFEVPDAAMDDLKVYLSERNISPGVSQWSADSGWIRSRLLQEILNQAVSVEAGDKVEMSRDAQVRRAVEALSR